MSGEEVKNKLKQNGYVITDVAKLLNMSQPQLSQILNKVDDVKSGLIEALCIALHKDLSFFYGGSKYMSASINDNSNNSQTINTLLEMLKQKDEKIDEMIAQIRRLERQVYNKISYGNEEDPRMVTKQL